MSRRHPRDDLVEEPGVFDPQARFTERDAEAGNLHLRQRTRKELARHVAERGLQRHRAHVDALGADLVDVQRFAALVPDDIGAGGKVEVLVAELLELGALALERACIRGKSVEPGLQARRDRPDVVAELDFIIRELEALRRRALRNVDIEIVHLDGVEMRDRAYANRNSSSRRHSTRRPWLSADIEREKRLEIHAEERAAAKLHMSARRVDVQALDAPFGEDENWRWIRA